MTNDTQQNRTAIKADWETKEFKELTQIPYIAQFEEAEFERLKRGLIPEAMEDKWFVYFADNTLYFHRSWTGMGMYQVQIVAHERGARVERAFVTTEVKSAQEHLDYSARLLNWLVSNLMLGRSEPFPHFDETSDTDSGNLGS